MTIWQEAALVAVIAFPFAALLAAVAYDRLAAIINGEE